MGGVSCAKKDEKHRELDDAWQHIGAMLNRMIERTDSFCNKL
jgi:hypothetical protein